ncbi:unnamed protein product [Pleuronectes platessa]|uniref:Uncharacterized protein n=1 Tax=Pleuronectes platessa TaxID=8262 RepID=A0A9N7U0V2_PLEPL|nr:unnamed protein product [Pleuronectes platessa]
MSSGVVLLWLINLFDQQQPEESLTCRSSGLLEVLTALGSLVCLRPAARSVYSCESSELEASAISTQQHFVMNGSALDGGTEGQRDGGTEGQRDRGTEGQRDRGTEGYSCNALQPLVNG